MLAAPTLAALLMGAVGTRQAMAAGVSASDGPATTDSAVASDATPAAVDAHPGDKDAKGPTGGPFGAFDNSRNRGPVNIQSDSLALDYKGNSVTFRGNVHASQADGQLTSNILNVKYGKDFHEIQEMIADGNVRMSQGTQWCTSDHAVQNQAAHTVVLTGSPVCHDANDQISGSKITVHTDTSKSEVEGGVKAVVFPRESKTRDNGAQTNPAQ
jgi:lipopolysaccharide transport protein LptA